MSIAPLMGETIEQTGPGRMRNTVLLGSPSDDEFQKLGTKAEELIRTGKARVPILEGDDRKELRGTGVLVSFAGGQVKGVLTAGHVIDSINRDQSERRLPGGPYIRISGTKWHGTAPSVSWEHSLVIPHIFTQTWGERAEGFREDRWKPDLGFIWLPSPHSELIQDNWDVRFYPWHRREARIARKREEKSELCRISLGMHGERQAKGGENHRVMAQVGLMPGKEQGWETSGGHEIWEYSLVGEEHEALVELERGGKSNRWRRVPVLPISTYGGTSGGGMWSVFWRPQGRRGDMTTELHGIVFAETRQKNGDVQSITALHTIGPGTIRQFLRNVLTELQERGVVADTGTSEFGRVEPV